MLDKPTSLLFHSYPREIGKKRSLVRDEREFISKIDLLNGVDEVFTNVNSVDGTMDKVFIDFDGPSALAESQQVYQFLLSNNIPSIPVASGKKGIHLYVLFKPRRGQDNKETLFKATKSLFISALGEHNKSVDPHVVGDLRRLCRVPNTLRPPENLAYCTFLPPSKGFLEMKPIDLCWYIKGTHTYPTEDYLGKNGFPTFEEVILPEVEKQKITFTVVPSIVPDKVYVDDEHLKQLLRPCLYRLLTVEEPRHHVRLAVTADLLLMDYTPDEILNMFRGLKWIDWDEDITRTQINSCKPIHTPKKTLKNMGICFNCGRSCR